MVKEVNGVELKTGDLVDLVGKVLGEMPDGKIVLKIMGFGKTKPKGDLPLLVCEPDLVLRVTGIYNPQDHIDLQEAYRKRDEVHA